MNSRVSRKVGHTRRRPTPFGVLFVCTGNIARSASSELIARHRCESSPQLEFASAGTAAVVGSPVAPEMGAELERRGVPFDGHRGQQLVGDMVRHADIVLVMETHHRQWILDEWPGAVGTTFLLKHAARELAAGFDPASAPVDPAAWLRTYSSKAQPDDGISDPFRKGEVAARVAMTEIEAALDQLLPVVEQWVSLTRN
ncbi:hypothetical protein [Kocuria massiliensis]|uniref:arsenate reductase/protein-tyrosine-phosphatase family protein n=1 Tax=Kocuria massiliensis TaxID=1926282 RepID=UPI000A1CD3CA|nr:hypothetical protein [Kocuria massiliensis]